MSGKSGLRILLVALLGLAALGALHAIRSRPRRSPPDSLAAVSTPSEDEGAAGSGPDADPLEQRFSRRVKPFLGRYCAGCHGAEMPEGALDLTRDSTVADVVRNVRHWERVLERLEAEEMPPEEAPLRPAPEERAEVVAWLRDLRDAEVKRKGDDPGPVLARRLSNAEYDYTIRDLTGVDIRPTREFPVDPANEAGFDNSGESLAMSGALLKKYLAAARLVADHIVLKPDGLVFAPHPAVTDTDRDKYCVQRIIDFYARHRVDLADYFLAAWRYRHREKFGREHDQLSAFATEAGLSARYLELIWSALTEAEAEEGPLEAVRRVWRDIPAPEGARLDAGRPSCERLRDLVERLRRQLRPKVNKLHVNGISDGSQPFVLWLNRQKASRHRTYSGEVLADVRKLAAECKNADAGLARCFEVKPGDEEAERRLRSSLERFCHVFPDAFVVTDRGPYFAPDAANKGRPLTAGFHLMQGYFRDDGPLCELILDDRQRQQIDGLWHELNVVTAAPLRQYRDFIFFERAEPPRYMREAEFDFARSEDRDCTSEAKMNRLAEAYLAKARRQGAGTQAQEAIKTYFAGISAEIRAVERARRGAEPCHLADLVRLAERAYRRPLSAAEKDDLLAFYRKLRREDGAGHEEAVRDTLATVLLSPHFCYRFDLVEQGPGPRPLSDYSLASRLSYFLWSSMPDEELLAVAARGDLQRPEVLAAQARRMLRHPRVRGLATEFGGNWLDFRRFEEHNSVDRGRFPSFTPQLRQAMFEEPIRYLVDVAQRNRPVLDLLHGRDTFVNGVLARHYGMPEPTRPHDWIHVEDAGRYGRGGLLPMGVFLTRNAPGLRTSPVKRGYWVVRRLLGEQIPPPPPAVPELPKDEASTGELTLPQLLAKHRDNPACAGCHKRFDSVGLAFEGYGPVGERRTKDLGGRPVEVVATFPDGKERKDIDGLREYLRQQRQDDFLDNVCSKLFSYALGRSLLLSDRKAVGEIKAKLAQDGYAFGSLVEAIVTSPQFRHKRGQEPGAR